VIQSAGALNSLSAYIQFLDDARVTVVSMPTALWHQLAKHVAQDHVKLPKALRLIVVGGEAGMTDALNLWHSHVGHYPQIVNAYGPTETTVSLIFLSFF
jgi:non-ribosomal peptide synthetase component F